MVKSKLKNRNRFAKALESRRFRQRIVKDKKKYNRKKNAQWKIENQDL